MHIFPFQPLQNQKQDGYLVQTKWKLLDAPFTIFGDVSSITTLKKRPILFESNRFLNFECETHN